MKSISKDDHVEQAENKEQVKQPKPERSEPPITYHLKPRRVDVNLISNQELQDLGSASVEGSLYLAVFGIAAGGLLTSGATLAVGGIANPYTFAGFVAVAIVSGLCTVCFGVRSYVSMQKARNRIHLLMKESENAVAELKDDRMSSGHEVGN